MTAQATPRDDDASAAEGGPTATSSSSAPLTDRVNVEPPILNGMTASEAKLVAVVAFAWWSLCGLVLAFLLSTWQVVIAFAIPGTVVTVWMVSTKLATIKRNRPDGYHRQAIHMWLAKRGLRSPMFITHHGHWELGRTWIARLTFQVALVAELPLNHLLTPLSMSTHPPIDALKSAREENKMLRYINVGVFLMSAIGMYLVHELPAHVTLHVAPNLRAGDQISIKDGRNEVPAPNVYAFAIYIWQQVNRWPKNGAKDYETQLFAFQSYLTPACYEQLRNDREARNNNGELIQRTRSLSQIPGQAYTSNRIVPDGANAWTVLLDMHVFETARGVPVKDTYVRYPMRVVEYDIDREKNPFQLALDCFGGNKPERLDPSAVGAAKPLAGVAAPLPPTQASQASAPSVPSQALPPPLTLPRDPVDQPTRP